MPNPRMGGPKPGIKKQLDEELKANPERVLALMLKLYEKGLAGDVNSAIYYIDRVMGKPTSINKIDASISQFLFTPDDMADMPGILDFASDRQRKLLNGTPVVTELDGNGASDDTQA